MFMSRSKDEPVENVFVVLRRYGFDRGLIYNVFSHGTEDFQKRPYKTRYVHSEAEISDFEPPELPSPGTSFKQAALKSMNTATKTNHYKSFLLRQPGHHDKNFNYLLKLYKPRHKRRCRTRHLFPSAGRYGEYEMRRVLSNRSLTESESEIENMSFISDDQNDYDSFHGSTNSLDRSAAKIENPIYKSLMKYKKLKMMGRDPNKLNSNPFNFPEPRIFSLEKYDDIAKIWLEQVDKKTVKKSDTMYLSVLPDGKDLPISLRPSKSYTPESDFSYNIRPQWVMARSRINIKKQLFDQFSESAFDHNVSTNFGKHLVLFFKVGYNWLELAWILFGDLLKESQIVRLIKDVQLKHPNNLTSQAFYPNSKCASILYSGHSVKQERHKTRSLQLIWLNVTDLMQRWWHTKGDGATIQELQKALDLLQIFYIEEELNDNEQPENSHFKVTEDILDVGVVTTKNPNVSRMSEEYNTKSLNNSFINSSRETKFVDDLSPEKVLKKNQFNSNGMNELLTSVNKLSRRNPHDESSDASNVVAFGKEENKKDTLDVSSTLTKKTTLKDRKKSPVGIYINLKILTKL
ncbi:hypothetical protein HELRODRAFT_160275 [Helobdella robusta]|uniref:Uncharacterized protein n=1 Tax=Helobdella robusta TaxID=6412 RepID=T1EQ13_HELRO|nr:hypothetical protein HELRODRAFT_160275 [Helobdella robusta]ESO06127.1 hypothetical protein HELRODRAFT_160275 [Helobdella robusta]